MNLGFIGIGKIACAVIEGFCTSGLENAVIRLSPRNDFNSRRLAAKYKQVTRMESNQEVLNQSDIVFLALRPPQAKEVLSTLKFNHRHIIVSLIPLIRHADMVLMTAPALEVCRAIPLPPVVNHNCPIPVYHAGHAIVELLSNLGQPLVVTSEDQLHALWTLTCLITPYYDLLNELSGWTIEKGVHPAVANQYVANLFQSLSYTAQIADPIDFGELAQHAATPNGMNEQAGREIRAKGAHEAYREVAEVILQRFPHSPA